MFHKFPFRHSTIFLKTLREVFGLLGATFGCGGTILTEWHILTAAHCVTDNGIWKTKQVDVAVGVHNPGSWKDEGAQKIKVAQLIIHELYMEDQKIENWKNNNRIKINNDIAILRLKDKIQIGKKVDLIDWRDSPSARYEGKEATAIGWGWTENTQPVNTPHSPSQLLHNVRLGTCNSQRRGLTC